VRRSLVMGLSVMLVLGTVSLAIGFVDMKEIEGFQSEDEGEYRIEDFLPKRKEDVNILAERIQKEASSRSEDELIEVMIRLTPYEFGELERTNSIGRDEIGTDYVSELKEHSRAQQSEIKEFLEEGGGEVLNTFWIANAILAEAPVGELDKLAEFDQVWRVHENFEVEIHDTEEDNLPTDESLDQRLKVRTNDTSGDLTWGLDRIGVSEAWEGGDIWKEGFNGTGVRVAISDTGIDIEHPDLEDKLITEDEDDPYYPGGWIEIDYHGEIEENSTPHEQHRGHGTHVSGTVVGGNASGTNIGVSPGAGLMHVGIHSPFYPVCSQLLASLEWKLEPRDRHGNMLHEQYGGEIEDYRPDVASMSWGGDYEEYRSEFEEPIKNLRNAGVVPVTSMGNHGEGTIGTPGSIYEDFAVGASDSDDNIAGFSSGDIVEDGRDDTPSEYVKPDFAAPGVNVKSSFVEGRWGEKWEHISGTSMATPHVSGTIALMLEANPDLTVDEIYEALRISADHYEAGESLFQEEKNTRYGHGIINAGKAVDYVSGLAIREPEDVTNEGTVLRADVLEWPDDDVDELDLLFRYRDEGENEWFSTEPESISQPQEFLIELDELEAGTTYEYKAVARLDDKEETTFSLTFTTHRDVELLSRPAEDITISSATMKGDLTHMYREEAEVFFRYRGKNESEWRKTESTTVDEPVKLEEELEDLDYKISYEYKLVGVSNGDEFTGDLMKFTTSPPEPEWDEEERAYQISTVGELQWINNDLENDFVLQDSIVASETKNWLPGKGFEPIGDDENGFNGTFDGNGYQIKDLYINRSDTEQVGLFSNVTESGIVRNVGLLDVDMNGAYHVGSVVGTNSGTLENLFATGNVSGESKIGGLVGTNNGTLTNSYAMVEVTGQSRVGGLVGEVIEGTVSASYSTGTVSGEDGVGGLVGWNNGSVENSYWDIETSSQDNSDGGVGLTTDEMTGAEAEKNMEGFDFDTDWETVLGDEKDVKEDGCPILQDIDRKTQLEVQRIFEEEEEDDILEIPGFTSTLLLPAIVLSSVIYYKKWSGMD